MPTQIFISYRRDDSAHISGRIYDALQARFSGAKLFIDVDNVAPGEDFVGKIEETIAAADTVLVVIGPGWLNAATREGERRVDLPGDFVRLEIKSALDQRIRIIPVLVDGAEMPRAEDLPEDIAGLVRHNAVTLDHKNFRRDFDFLAEHLDGPGAFLPGVTRPRLIALAGTAALTVLLGLVLLRPPQPPAPVAALSVSIGLAPSADLAPSEDPESWARHMLEIDYRSERDASGVLQIRADLPYLDRLETERVINGEPFRAGPVSFMPPRLQIRATNTTDAAVFASELEFFVAAAMPDLTPLPIIREREQDFQMIRVMNEGWGPMAPATVTIENWRLPDEADLSQLKWGQRAVLTDECGAGGYWLNIPVGPVQGEDTGDGDFVFGLSDRVPAAFEGEQFVCAEGELTYTAASETQTVLFRTRISNLPPMMEVADIRIGFYDLFLDPDRSGYSVSLPANVEIAPGDTEIFNVAVYTSQSTAVTLESSVQTSAGRVEGEAFQLSMIVPRRDRTTWGPAPAE